MGRKSYKIEVGDEFNRLIVIGPKEGHHIWCECKCQLKTKKLIAIRYLINKRTESCGCLVKERVGKLNCSHNMSNNKIYKIYEGMKKRCSAKEGSHHYKYYTQKNIKLCDSWNKDFINFYSWAISNGYQDNLTIERKDNLKDYCPENCCWIPFIEQAKNRSSNIKVKFDGEIKTLKDWSKDLRCEVTYNTLYQRIKSGKSLEISLKKVLNENN